MVTNAATSAELLLLLRAKDEASKTVEGFTGKITSAFNAIPGPVKVAGAAGVAALAGLGAAALAVAGDFDDAYDRIRTGTGATGEALEGLQDSFRNVFKSVPTDMESASIAISELNTRLGLSGPHLEVLSAQFLELSRITGADLATNIESATRVFGDWGITTENQSQALDTLFKTSQATGPSVQRLGDMIVQYGAPLRQFGFSFEEAAALMGKFEKEGVNTELVMGSLRIAIGKFAKDNIPLRKGLDDTIERIQELGPGAEATALAMEIFGARAGPDMAAAILEGKFAIEDLVGAVEASEDSIFKVGRETQDWQEQLTLLKNEVLIALEPVIMRFHELVGMAASNLRQVVAAVVDFLQGGQNMEDMLAEMPGFWRGVTLAIIDVIEAVRAVVSFVQQHWPTISAVFNAWWEFTKERIEGFIQLVGGIVEVVTSTIELVKALFRGDWSTAWNEMKDIAGGIIDIFIGYIKTQFGTIPEILLGLVSSAASAGVQLGNAIKDGILQGLTFAGNLVGDIANTLVRSIKDIINTIIDAVNNAIPNDIGFDTPFGRASVDLPDNPVPRLAGGHPFIPFDDFPAYLHRGERVLTAEQNRQYMNDHSQRTIRNYGPVYINGERRGRQRRDGLDLLMARL